MYGTDKLLSHSNGGVAQQDIPTSPLIGWISCAYFFAQWVLFDKCRPWNSTLDLNLE